MNTINFNQSVGFPLETETLDEMQKCWNILNAFGEIVAPLAIIKGCVVAGSNVSDGFVYINGELLKFVGGAVQATVIIVQNPTSVEFEDGNSHEVYYERYATFGSGITNYAWADFKRGMPTSDISAALDLKANITLINTLITRIEDLEARPIANVPIGMIAIWDRPAHEIPEGWEEYEELQGRTPVGFDSDYDSNITGDLTNYNLGTLGYAGGKTEHQLTILEMPSHTHEFIKENTLGTGSNGAQDGQSSFSTVQTEPTGGSQRHTNMQPYRIVHFIKYVG